VVLTKVLVVTAGGERFGAPLAAVHETHLVEAGEISAVRVGRAYVRRERVIPLLRLTDLLGLSGARPSASFPVLAIEAGGEPVGVQVEAINERIEAPLRPLSGLLRGFPGALGAVLQGDGQVLLVLDLAELAQREAAR
jgi:two-component system chemotaxis sensor kinase CheA